MPEPPKPGCVSFGAIDVGVIWSFVWVGGSVADAQMRADISASVLLERIPGGRAKAGEGVQ